MSVVKVSLKRLKSHEILDFNMQIGIIGGTGLDDPDILQERQEIVADTPYGKVLGLGTRLGTSVVRCAMRA